MLDSLIIAKRHSLATAGLMVALIVQQSYEIVFADQIKSQINKSPTPPITRPNPVEGYQKLKDAPSTDFPDLPVFQCKTKFLNGYYSPNKNGISVCQMNYVSQEDPKEVLDFYKNAFSSNGWKIEFAAGPAISARHKDGHLCSVNVMDSKLPQRKSQFIIAYRQIVK